MLCVQPALAAFFGKVGFQGLTWMPGCGTKHAHIGEFTMRKSRPILVPHLLCPLDWKRRTGGRLGPSWPRLPDDQVECTHPRFDRLAPGHLVGDQEVDPWPLVDARTRDQAVVLNSMSDRNGSGSSARMRRTKRSPTGKHREKSQAGREGSENQWDRAGRGFLDHPGPQAQAPSDVSIFAQAVVPRPRPT